VINKPNADIYHIPAWRNLSETYKAGGIEVINCSPTSKIKGLFPFMSLEESGIYG